MTLYVLAANNQMYGGADSTSTHDARPVRLLPQCATLHDDAAAIRTSRDRIQRGTGTRDTAQAGTGRHLHR